MKKTEYKYTRIGDLVFNIPPVQRGLVWSPEKVMKLWDSLSKGYPIGALMAYKDKDGEQLNLLDGQQRYNAICMGIASDICESSGDTTITDVKKKQKAFSDKSHAQIWVKQSSGKPVFMVCTSCHPWGFCWEADEVKVLSPTSQEEANNAFLERELSDNDKLPLRELFLKAELKKGYPWVEKEEYVPLPLLMKYGKGEGLKLLNEWHGNESSFGHILELSEAQEIMLEKIESMLNSDWLKTIKETEVPVIIWQPRGKNLEELFTRINKGGEPLSSPDQSYSSLCAYCAVNGLDLKSANEKIAEGFLPPERLAGIAAGLVQSEYGTWSPSVESSTIRNWFDGDIRGEEFKKLYLKKSDSQESLQSLVSLFRRMCKLDEKMKDFNDAKEAMAKLPAAIYLSQNKHWLFTMLWTMKKFRYAFESSEGSKFFHLFCMLPHVMVGDDSALTYERFSRRFYEALKKIDGEDCGASLLDLMAVGCSYAALEETCCIYPYPTLSGAASSSGPEDEQKWLSLLKEDKDGLWRSIYTKISGTKGNPILYYYQRVYMNYMLEQSGFNPGMRVHWDTETNRPWDIDHIIPTEWWSEIKKENMTRPIPEECMKEIEDKDNTKNDIGNMQVLDFRRNRSKSNHSINLKQRYEPDDFAPVCLRTNDGERIDDGMVARNAQPEPWDKIELHARKGKEAGIENRLDYIIQCVAEELHLFEFIVRMNNLASNPVMERLEASHELSVVVERYRFMKQIFDKMKREPQLKPLVRWGMSEFEWKQRRKSMYENRCVPVYPMQQSHPEPELDIYHSLIPWLYVGIPYTPVDKGAPAHYICVGIHFNKSYVYGVLRGLNVHLEDWKKYYIRKKDITIDEWWLTTEQLTPVLRTEYQELRDNPDFGDELIKFAKDKLTEDDVTS